MKKQEGFCSDLIYLIPCYQVVIRRFLIWYNCCFVETRYSGTRSSGIIIRSRSEIYASRKSSMASEWDNLKSNTVDVILSIRFSRDDFLTQINSKGLDRMKTSRASLLQQQRHLIRTSRGIFLTVSYQIRHEDIFLRYSLIR